ncbi:MAG: hypothetical protein O8C63_01975 [Candidatus Methanoperedens sp.]|nr:hypothetical protein [Candidatus Methanoperedens sp.]
MGIALLANVAFRGALTSPGPLKLLATEVPNLAIGTFPFTFIPGLMVPLALVLHLLAIRALRMRMQYAPIDPKRKIDAAYPPLQAGDSTQVAPQCTSPSEKYKGTAASYQFPNLTARLFIEDMRFSPEDATPGSSAPDSIVYALEGHPISSRELLAGHTSLIFFGSASCPMTFGSIEPLRDLYEKYGQQVQFIMLAVREAHPAENLKQPQEMDLKLKHACELATSAAAPWKTVVDSIDGALHRALAAKPNAAFLIGPDGTVLFRALWAGDKTGLDAALEDATQGRAVRHPTRTALFRPLILSLGYFDAILTRSGPQARKDLWHAFPPVAFLAWTTSLFKGLLAAKRGSVAIGVLTGIIVVMINSVTHFSP